MEQTSLGASGGDSAGLPMPFSKLNSEANLLENKARKPAGVTTVHHCKRSSYTTARP
jgi:hypothetical protein